MYPQPHVCQFQPLEITIDITLYLGLLPMSAHFFTITKSTFYWWEAYKLASLAVGTWHSRALLYKISIAQRPPYKLDLKGLFSHSLKKCEENRKILKKDSYIIVNKIRIQSIHLTASSRYNHVSTIYVYSLTENHCILICKVNYTHTTNIWLLFWDFTISINITQNGILRIKDIL